MGFPGTRYMGNGVSIVLDEKWALGPALFTVVLPATVLAPKHVIEKDSDRNMSAGLFCFRTFNATMRASVQFSSAIQSTVKKESFFASALSACESSLLVLGLIVIVCLESLFLEFHWFTVNGLSVVIVQSKIIWPKCSQSCSKRTLVRFNCNEKAI